MNRPFRTWKNDPKSDISVLILANIFVDNIIEIGMSTM